MHCLLIVDGQHNVTRLSIQAALLYAEANTQLSATAAVQASCYGVSYGCSRYHTYHICVEAYDVLYRPEHCLIILWQ